MTDKEFVKSVYPNALTNLDDGNTAWLAWKTAYEWIL